MGQVIWKMNTLEKIFPTFKIHTLVFDPCRLENQLQELGFDKAVRKNSEKGSKA